jgi:hypothetical protein
MRHPAQALVGARQLSAFRRLVTGVYVATLGVPNAVGGRRSAASRADTRAIGSGANICEQIVWTTHFRLPADRGPRCASEGNKRSCRRHVRTWARFGSK